MQTQQQDVSVINLAGRQQMTRLAFQVQDGDDSALDALQESEQIFDQTLAALRNGGTAPYLTNSVVDLPVTRDRKLLAALDEVDSIWTRYRFTLEAMTSSMPPPPLYELLLQNNPMIWCKEPIWWCVSTKPKPPPK
ncbi:MAG: type IV pili methyl-accepting chemotaxis transducer N-terminal domain-containing protein [Chloroflexi bacterium]|nr:type IV pili methyl-accepting chemotaxis transducer N-terminal domain-containing protein [Chloroflexota bacterium]